MKYDNQEVVHKKIGDIQYLQFRALLKYKDNLQHCFTFRHGGVSSDKYNSLNLGLNTGDNIQNVKQNYISVCNIMNFNYDNLFRGIQTHSDKLIFVTKENCGSVLKDIDIECDGSITNIANIPLVTNSADCMTVLIYDNTNKYIASIHSGWQGVINGIVVKAINKLINEFNCSSKNLIVCICPSICKNCFEVMNDVKEKFESKFRYNDIIIKKDDTHYLIDLQLILKNEILSTGVLDENIHFSGICNKCNVEDFYSFRNDKVTGRMGCFIMLK